MIMTERRLEILAALRDEKSGLTMRDLGKVGAQMCRGVLVPAGLVEIGGTNAKFRYALTEKGRRRLRENEG